MKRKQRALIVEYYVKSFGGDLPDPMPAKQ